MDTLEGSTPVASISPKNSAHPPYRMVGKVRFVKLNGDWLNTTSIESISKPANGAVVVRTKSGAELTVHGVYSADALTRGVLGPRFDQPDNS